MQNLPSDRVAKRCREPSPYKNSNISFHSPSAEHTQIASPIIMATPFFGEFKHISSLTIISSPLCSHYHFHQQSKRENPLRSHEKTDFPPSIQSNGSFLFFQLIARESSRLLQPGRRLLAREGERREKSTV